MTREKLARDVRTIALVCAFLGPLLAISGLGALGAAFSEPALERRLKTLQGIGVNAVRYSHNPMAPEMYDLCDRLGLLVMDEAFDEWTAGKNKWIKGWNAGTPGKAGYHEAFDEWSTRDIQDMVLRDRNHPSIAVWCGRNEGVPQPVINVIPPAQVGQQQD